MPAELIHTQEGTLPIIVSAPHGGTLAIPGVPERTGVGLAKGGAGFVVVRDAGTEELALALAAALEKRLGKKPYVVVARFHRKHLDVNRPAKIGLESPAAQSTYDAYHAALAKFCKAVQKAHGRGLLLDVHGQAFATDTVFRGTRNGQTVTLLRQRFGADAHVGKASLFGLLAAEGVKVFPETGSTAKERPGYAGGHIVGTYGSHDAFGIDAVQLECGAEFRTTAARRDAATGKFAAAVVGYHRRYLLEPAAK